MDYDKNLGLVRYVGWGGLPQVFDPWNEEWQPERERMALVVAGCIRLLQNAHDPFHQSYTART
jgi:hypothetical protein